MEINCRVLGVETKQPSYWTPQKYVMLLVRSTELLLVGYEALQRKEQNCAVGEVFKKCAESCSAASHAGVDSLSYNTNMQSAAKPEQTCFSLLFSLLCHSSYLLHTTCSYKRFI